MKLKLFLLCTTIFCCCKASAQSSFLLQPTGQANYETCQSYSLAVALAIKHDAAFPIVTAADLQKTELAIRAEIKKVAGNTSVNHAHIEAGFKAFTNGAYILKIENLPEDQLGEKIGQYTGISNKAAVPPSFLLDSTVKDVVLTSTTRIGSNKYASSHIIAAFGMDGPPNSNRSYLFLNSAVKAKDKTKNVCQEGIPDDPGPYTALLSWVSTSEIDFTKFGGVVKLWRVQKP